MWCQWILKNLKVGGRNRYPWGLALLKNMVSIVKIKETKAKIEKCHIPNKIQKLMQN
jgi:hypothetical protein